MTLTRVIDSDSSRVRVTKNRDSGRVIDSSHAITGFQSTLLCFALKRMSALLGMARSSKQSCLLNLQSRRQGELWWARLPQIEIGNTIN